MITKQLVVQAQTTKHREFTTLVLTSLLLPLKGGAVGCALVLTVVSWAGGVVRDPHHGQTRPQRPNSRGSGTAKGEVAAN